MQAFQFIDEPVPAQFSHDRTALIFYPVEYLSRGKPTTYILSVVFCENNIPTSMPKDVFNASTYKFDRPLVGFIPREVSSYNAHIRASTATKDDIVTVGKNLGKKNETNCMTQAIKDAFSKYKAFIKGKVLVGASATSATSVMSAASATTTTGIASSDIVVNVSRPFPMLLKAIDSTGAATWGPDVYSGPGVMCQPKYNGHRMVIYMDPLSKKVTCYSRTCETYVGFIDIEKEFGLIYLSLMATITDVSNLPYFDGEVWAPGMELREISGLARSLDGRDKSMVKFMMFDVFFRHDMPSGERQAYIDGIMASEPAMSCKHIERVQTVRVSSKVEAIELSKKFVEQGLEGAIIRRNDKPYEHCPNNKHSSNVLKIKPLYDSEFTIVGFVDGGRGKNANMMLWRCVAPNGEEFSVSLKNITNAQNERLLASFKSNPALFDAFKGKKVTLEYADLPNPIGIPSQAKATTVFKDDTRESGDEEDYSSLNALFASLTV